MDLKNHHSIYTTLKQAPESLARYLKHNQFEILVEDRTQNFIGRQFIFNAIDKLIEDFNFPSGYIFIKGEPGVGKTSLIAQLVKKCGYVHHFNVRSQGIISTSAFLQNICAQLIVLYQLKYSELTIESDRDSSFLSTLLLEASAGNNQDIVILVDALDEAEDTDSLSQFGINKLLLPPTLPNRVFFVITTREQSDHHLLVDREESIYLNDDDPQNLADVKLYIENYLFEHPVQMNTALTDWSINPQDFVELMTEKSHGNFMYLVYVLRDIREAKLNAANIDDLRKLPAGLKNYYRHHWMRMRKREEQVFAEIYEPVVCTLAAAKEPISLVKICEITNLALRDAKRVLDEWREFLNETETKTDGRLYRLYHSSFRDFLDEEVNLTSYHKLIATRAEEKIT
jgi:hypothetical protein